MSSLVDFSNIPQLQNLQSLISLAQANPDLLSQLTTDSLYGGGPSQLSNALMSHASSIKATSSPSLNPIHSNIANVTNQADALNQDIDDLGISLQALAQHLGFDSTKESTDQQNVEDDLLDMDEFLNTYGICHLNSMYFN